MSTYLNDLIQRLEAEASEQRKYLATSLSKNAIGISHEQLNRTLQRLQTLRNLRTKEDSRT